MFVVQVGKYQRWDFHSESTFSECVRDRSEGIHKAFKDYGATLVADKHPMYAADCEYQANLIKANSPS